MPEFSFPKGKSRILFLIDPNRDRIRSICDWSKSISQPFLSRNPNKCQARQCTITLTLPHRRISKGESPGYSHQHRVVLRYHKKVVIKSLQKQHIPPNERFYRKREYCSAIWNYSEQIKTINPIHLGSIYVNINFPPA